MEEKIPKEINIQKKDICKTYRSNSQFHYKDISNFNYEDRIRLNPLGESKNFELRNHFPLIMFKNPLQKQIIYQKDIKIIKILMIKLILNQKYTQLLNNKNIKLF